MLTLKTVRTLAAGTALATACGGLLFGGELLSYASTAFSSARDTARGAVPVGFEIERARQLLADVTPELHANLQRVASEEVEVEALAREVAAGAQRLERQRAELARRRAAAGDGADAASGPTLSALARAAGVFEEAARAQASRAELLAVRTNALAAASADLERTRARQSVLADRIDGLAAQASVLEVTAAGRSAGLGLQASAFDRTTGLVDDLEKRLDVAERVLAREASLFPAFPGTESGLASGGEPGLDSTDDPASVLARVDAIVGR